MTKEKLFEQEYDIGEKVLFSFYRQQEDGSNQVEMILSYLFPASQTEETICKRIRFPVQAESYDSPLLDWYNLICCSNNYGPIPVVSYMNYAVQNEKKIAATIYPNTASEYMEILANTKEGYYCFPYNIKEYQYSLYISRLGCIRDYFDLDEVFQVYASCGIDLNYDRLKEYFEKELSWFGELETCPIDIHNCKGREALVAVGLLFGYPIAGTVALIQKTILDN